MVVKVTAGVLLGLFAGIAWCVRPSAFGTQSKPMPATVHILAVSSSSRQSFAGNQDVYLADVQLKDGQHRFVRLVDQYPGFGLPIRPDLLREQTALTMMVTREPECDENGSLVYLSPNGRAVFNGSVRDTLMSDANESVPCFKTLHQTIRIAKK